MILKKVFYISKYVQILFDASCVISLDIVHYIIWPLDLVAVATIHNIFPTTYYLSPNLFLQKWSGTVVKNKNIVHVYW